MSLSSSVPEAYLVAAEQWASEGCYVLGMSYRSDQASVTFVQAAVSELLNGGLFWVCHIGQITLALYLPNFFVCMHSQCHCTCKRSNMFTTAQV